MENQRELPQEKISTVIKADPLPMERKEKLKIWATVSIHEDVPQQILAEKKLLLSVVLAYNKPDADRGVSEGLKILGFDPNKHKRQLQTALELDKIMNMAVPVLKAINKVIKEETKDIVREGEMGVPAENKKKSMDELVAHVLYVFDTVGTDDEKKVAEKVIDKFRKQK